MLRLSWFLLSVLPSRLPFCYKRIVGLPPNPSPLVFSPGRWRLFLPNLSERCMTSVLVEELLCGFAIQAAQTIDYWICWRSLVVSFFCNCFPQTTFANPLLLGTTTCSLEKKDLSYDATSELPFLQALEAYSTITAAQRPAAMNPQIQRIRQNISLDDESWPRRRLLATTRCGVIWSRTASFIFQTLSIVVDPSWSDDS
jgi:hypothetical protein